MKKYLFLCSLFCILTFQPAYAQKYEYTGHNTPTYININGEQYVRIPRPQETNSQRYTVYSDSTQKNNQSQNNYTLSSSTTIRPYIGLDIGYNKLDRTTLKDEAITEFTSISYTQFPKNNIALSGILGLKLTPHFSLEAFYQDTIYKNKKNGTTTLTNHHVDATFYAKSSTALSFDAFGLDAIFNTPIYNQNLQLLLALGIGYYNIDAKYKIKKANPNGEDLSLSTSDKSTGYRFGIGAQYNFNKHLSLRTMLRHVKLTDDKIIDDMIEFSTGLRYYF